MLKVLEVHMSCGTADSSNEKGEADPSVKMEECHGGQTTIIASKRRYTELFLLR